MVIMIWLAGATVIGLIIFYLLSHSDEWENKKLRKRLGRPIPPPEFYEVVTWYDLVKDSTRMKELLTEMWLDLKRKGE